MRSLEPSSIASEPGYGSVHDLVDHFKGDEAQGRYGVGDMVLASLNYLTYRNTIYSVYVFWCIS
jgi:hypothetical protein